MNYFLLLVSLLLMSCSIHNTHAVSQDGHVRVMNAANQAFDELNISGQDRKTAAEIKTKYPVVDGYPVWVKTPSVCGYSVTAVGAAAFHGDAYQQKRAAMMQAQAEIAKIINVKIDNEITSKRYSYNLHGEHSDFNEVKSYSRQRSSELLNSLIEVDQWINPENGDYYILLAVDEKSGGEQ